jgi:acetyl-CoA synthetase
MATADEFLRMRDFLLTHREDYATAINGFRWPVPGPFNWALDYFDRMATENHATALWIVAADRAETKISFDELRLRSNRLANFLSRAGVRRGDRILVMVGNEPPLWETFLASMKLGTVLIPAATLLTPADISDRYARGQFRFVVADGAHAPKFAQPGMDFTGIAVGSPAPELQRYGWLRFDDAANERDHFEPDGATLSHDPMLLYFTSGTTALPKLVQHTHASYPIGHLSTMYWLGLQPGDVHWNISSPGWAKHAWSCIFAPWNAGATVFSYNYSRFHGPDVLGVLQEKPVSSLCAPATVWRMLIQDPLAEYRVHLRELASAGEPLNPEIIEQVRAAWGITIRDAYGQTETTAMIGNSPGQKVKAGSMGRVLPGYQIDLAENGEICVQRNPHPVGLMVGYSDTPMPHGSYHTGDIAQRDEDGYFTYTGRDDDVFKASDYRISPFELESVLLEHAAVAESAVVPCPDALRSAVPKAFVTLAAGHAPDAETARSIFAFLRERLPPFKKVRRIEFAELPKTISGKIRRAELRRMQAERAGKAAGEFFDD